MDVIMNVLMVIIAITSVIAVMLVLLNRGQGGGLSDMFGGGMTNSLNSSGMASKNLIRLTVTVIVIWVIAVVLYGLPCALTARSSSSRLSPEPTPTPPRVSQIELLPGTSQPRMPGIFYAPNGNDESGSGVRIFTA